MPDSGTITATARNQILDQDYTQTHPNVSAGAYIAISIEDTGIGMDQRSEERRVGKEC